MPGGIAVAAVCTLLFAGALVVAVLYLTSNQTIADGRREKFIAWVIKWMPLQSIKIVIVAWQILTQFAAVANVTYPDVYQRFLDAVDILNFDLGWIISVGCIFDIDFHDQLLLSTTTGPLCLVALMGTTYAVAVLRHRGSPNMSAAIQVVRQKHLSMVLLVTFLIYSSVSSTVFRMFACEHLDDGNYYLRSDYRIHCDTTKHRVLQLYAGFMILVYPVGIPMFYAVLLWNNRDVLTNETGRVSNIRVKSITDLWQPYKPNRFYYEIIECGRRILLTGVVVFIYPNTSSQIAVNLMIAVAFMIIAEALAPFASRWDAWLSRTGHLIVFTSMYVALLLRVDVSNERARSQEVFGVIIVGTHACMIMAVVMEAIVTAYVLRNEEVREKNEDMWPRLRRDRRVSSFMEDIEPHDAISVGNSVTDHHSLGGEV